MTELRARWLPAFLTIALASAPLALHAQPASLPFQDPTLPVDERVDDLVARMTLEEKASQLVNRTRAIPRLNVPEYNLWSEALHGVAGGGFATVFPQAIGLAATFDAPAAPRDGRRDGARGPRQVQPGRAGRPRRAHDGRADVLLAEHQHLPRPALGPRAGDLRRGSLPGRRGSASPSSRACRATTPITPS